MKLEDKPRHMFWEMMARLIGRPDLAVDRDLVFDTQQLAVQYAMMGDGLALADPILFAEDIKAGRLVRPFDIWLDEGYGYYLTTHPEDLSNEEVALFRSWLIARFAADREQLEEAVGDKAPKAVAK
jgi:DNA-binding transcriptional LysR family regulator